jgi:phasin family protein
MDTAMRIAGIMTEANSRLFRLQSEAADAALADASKHINSLLNSAKSPAAALAEWPTLYQENVQRMVAVTRTWFEILSQTQSELSKLVGGSLLPNGLGAQNYLDQFTKAISGARGIAETQMKDFVARAGDLKASKTEKAA